MFVLVLFVFFWCAGKLKACIWQKPVESEKADPRTQGAPMGNDREEVSELFYAQYPEWAFLCIVSSTM